ncbi:hypothetical protein HYY75_02620, partial [bacterium]|nr:hypothetical protein [bacterium]
MSSLSDRETRTDVVCNKMMLTDCFLSIPRKARKPQFQPSNRHGVVIVVVLGIILVLSITVLGYNFLVRGKHLETMDVLKHLKAFKIAQSLNRYIWARMKIDFQDQQSGLKQKFMKTNDPNLLQKEVNDWLVAIQGDVENLAGTMCAPYPKKEVSIKTFLSFSDVSPFYGDSNDGVHYLSCEKSGNINLTVELWLGKSLEVFEEKRPFKMISLVPIPLGKFTLYISQANSSNDDFKYNTVNLDLEGRPTQNSPRPLVFFHGKPAQASNRQPDIWKRRGWVYLGGSSVMLNRAGSFKNYGQSFHSYYPSGNMPVALRLNFENFDSISGGGRALVFKSARWGFSEMLTNAETIDTWKKLLPDDSTQFPTSKIPFWRSTCLHLFGLGESNETRSITRVCGNVFDRFLDMSYLVTNPAEGGPLGGVIGLSKSLFSLSSGKQALGGNVSLDKLIQIVPTVQQKLQLANVDFLKDFFKQLPFEADIQAISYI